MRHAPVGNEQPVTASKWLPGTATLAIPRHRIGDDFEDDEPRSGGIVPDDQVLIDEDDEDIDPDEDKGPPRPD